MAITKDEFKEIMKTIVALFPKEELKLSKDMMDIWYEALSDLDYRRASEGLVLYAQESNWMPTIADIRKYANKVPKYTKEEIHQFIVEAHKKERQNDSFGF